MTDMRGRAAYGHPPQEERVKIMKDCNECFNHAPNRSPWAALHLYEGQHWVRPTSLYGVLLCKSIQYSEKGLVLVRYHTQSHKYYHLPGRVVTSSPPQQDSQDPKVGIAVQQDHSGGSSGLLCLSRTSESTLSHANEAELGIHQIRVRRIWTTYIIVDPRSHPPCLC